MTLSPFKPLAELARQRAAELATARIAWLCVAEVLDRARTIVQAREVLDEEIPSAGLRELAGQLLGELTAASPQAERTTTP